MNVWAFKYQIREVKYQQNVASDVANTSKDAGKLSLNSACSKSHSKCIEREIDPIEISSNKPNSSLDILGGLNESGGTSLIEMTRVSSVSLVENYGAPPSSKSWVERASNPRDAPALPLIAILRGPMGAARRMRNQIDLASMNWINEKFHYSLLALRYELSSTRGSSGGVAARCERCEMSTSQMKQRAHLTNRRLDPQVRFRYQTEPWARHKQQKHTSTTKRISQCEGEQSLDWPDTWKSHRYRQARSQKTRRWFVQSEDDHRAWFLY